VSGAPEWRDRLARRRDELVARARDGDEEWLERRLDDLDRLDRFVVELADRTSESFAEWADWCTWAAGLVDRYLGRPPAWWPDEEANAHDHVLDRLAALGALPTTVPVDRATFRAALAEELDQTVGHVGSFGTGVLLAPLRALRGTDFDAVFVVGASEGRLPPPPRDDPLLPDRERAVTGGQVEACAAVAARERADYLAALAAARGVVTLSWSRADPVGQRVQLPSRWIVETVRARTGRPLTARELAEAAPDTIPELLVIESFAAAVARDATPISVGELELATLERERVSGRDAAFHGLATDNPTIARGLRAARARAESRFTEYDGVVGPRPGLLPRPDRPLSPSRIEAWAQCPFRYLLANILGLRARETPEELFTIDPRTRGSLVHKVLEDFVQEVPARTSPSEPWTDAERARARQIAEGLCDAAEAAGQTGRPLLWQLERARILREVSRTLDADERIRAHRGLVPFDTEIDFGKDPDDPMPALTLDLGDATVTFRGQIDRIDVSPDPDGTVAVYDYKTGSTKGYDKLDEDPVAAGTKLQLAIYALAVEQAFPGRPIRAAYWHTAQPAGKELRGFDLADAAPRAREVLTTVAGGVAAGTFPAHSGKENPVFGSFEECGFCDFDQLCSPDRERMFEAKRRDPVVSTVVELRGLGEDA
jgi:RecB family exonuclease